MKNVSLLFAGLAFLLFSFAPPSVVSKEKYVILTFEYGATNVEEGYSYPCKLRVYVDGQQVGESSVREQKLSNSVTVNMSQGNHRVRAILLVDYKGTWEEHLIVNDYSINCLWEKSGYFTKKKMRVRLLFDIDRGTIEK